MIETGVWLVGVVVMAYVTLLVFVLVLTIIGGVFAAPFWAWEALTAKPDLDAPVYQWSSGPKEPLYHKNYGVL